MMSKREIYKNESLASYFQYTIYLSDDYHQWSGSLGSILYHNGYIENLGSYNRDNVAYFASIGRYIQAWKEENKDVCYLSSIEEKGRPNFWEEYESHIKVYLKKYKCLSDYRFEYHSLNNRKYKKGEKAILCNSFITIEILFLKDCIVKKDKSEIRPWFHYRFDFEEAYIASFEEKKEKAQNLELDCCRYFRENKWMSRCTKSSGDFGADVLAMRQTDNGNLVSIVIQCKAHKKQVGIDAVQQVFSAAYFYKLKFRTSCNKATYTF